MREMYVEIDLLVDETSDILQSRYFHVVQSGPLGLMKSARI